MFYREEKSRCINCRNKYSIEYYIRKKKRLMVERKQRQQQSISCPDAKEATFLHEWAFKRFCQARRDIKQWREDVFISCSGCSLQDRVDLGFVPKDIKTLVSLMAHMN
jgi:hypothetical protein